MWLTVTIGVIILVCVVYLFFLIFRHVPELKNINIGTIAKEKQDAAKTKILHAKISRSSAQAKDKLSTIFSPMGKFFRAKVLHLKNRALELESKYYDDKKDKIRPARTIDELFIEAEDCLERSDVVAAEKALIEVIAKDNKNVRAYKMLGELYFVNKNYDQAEEIFKYLIKLQSIGADDYEKLGLIALSRDRLEEAEMDFLSSLDINNNVAFYYDDLTKVYEAMKKDDKALDCALKATSIEPNNPKYLDKLIQLSIKLGDRGLAKKTFNHLKKINPENAKLKELQTAIEKI